VADTWVGSEAATTAHGTDTVLYSVTSSTLTKVSYLKFDLSALAGKTLTGASLKVTTTTGSSSGSPAAQNVYRATDTSWTESGLTCNRQIDALIEGLALHRALDGDPFDRSLTEEAVRQMLAPTLVPSTSA
jgi:hypothetical protein